MFIYNNKTPGARLTRLTITDDTITVYGPNTDDLFMNRFRTQSDEMVSFINSEDAAHHNKHTDGDQQLDHYHIQHPHPVTFADLRHLLDHLNRLATDSDYLIECQQQVLDYLSSRERALFRVLVTAYIPRFLSQQPASIASLAPAQAHELARQQSEELVLRTDFSSRPRIVAHQPTLPILSTDAIAKCLSAFKHYSSGPLTLAYKTSTVAMPSLTSVLDKNSEDKASYSISR